MSGDSGYSEPLLSVDESTSGTTLIDQIVTSTKAAAMEIVTESITTTTTLAPVETTTTAALREESTTSLITEAATKAIEVINRERMLVDHKIALDENAPTTLAPTAAISEAQQDGMRKEYVIIIILAIVGFILTVAFLVIILIKRRTLARQQQQENLPESVPLKEVSKA